MIVTHLSLADFRNYETLEIGLVAGTNVFVGSNGQGKTNLVEAIAYLSTLGSHRVSNDQALIRSGAESAIVRAKLEHAQREVLLEVQLNRSGANRAQVNRVSVKPRELTRHVSTVAFAPEDLALVRGEPAVRRRFLDQLLVQLSPRLATTLGDYDRVVRQRNTLLKSARNVRASDLSTLELWDDRMIEIGSVIIAARWSLVEKLRPRLQEAYRSIAGLGHRVELALDLTTQGAHPEDDSDQEQPDSPQSNRETQDEFRDAIARVRKAELDRGMSLVGPHRDDLRLVLNDLTARGYASHGESWSIALSLRLASAALLREESQVGDPIVVLDDVFAELDEPRRAQLAEAIEDYEQVLITAAVVGDVPKLLSGHTVHIRQGAIVREDS